MAAIHDTTIFIATIDRFKESNLTSTCLGGFSQSPQTQLIKMIDINTKISVVLCNFIY